MQQKRHKRWYNAYILFYERQDAEETMPIPNKLMESMSLSKYKKYQKNIYIYFFSGGRSARPSVMPVALEEIVNRQNMKFCHRRNQFTHEFFAFIRLLCSNTIAFFRT